MSDTNDSKDKQDESGQSLVDQIMARINESDAEVSDTEEAILTQVREALATQAKRTDTPEQERMRRATKSDETVEKRGVDVRPYGTAARAFPADLAPARYRGLPKWRNADDDYVVAQYFRGMYRASLQRGEAGADSGKLLREVMEKDKEVRSRALLDIGATGGTDGVFQGEVGEALPLPVANYLLETFYNDSVFLGLTRQFTGMESVRVPIQSANASSGSTAEGDTISEGAGAVKTHINLRVQKQTNLANITNELLAAPNTSFGIASWVIADGTGELAENVDTLLYATGLGAGADEPAALELDDVIVSGEITDTSMLATVTQVADFFLTTLISAADVRALFYAVPRKERRNMIFSGNDQVALALSNITDDADRPIYASAMDPSTVVGDALALGAVGTIHGRPFFNLPGKEEALGSGPDANSNRLYAMNPTRTYATLQMGGITVSTSDQEKFSDDVTVFKFIHRIDGGTMGNTNARKQYRFLAGINGAA